MEANVELPSEDIRQEMASESNRQQPVAASAGLFSFADRLDWVLMLFGSVGSCVHGAALPLFFVLFGRLIDSLGSLSSHPHRLASEVSKNALQLVYLGLLVMASAWIGVAFWMQTAERQTARLRVKYIQSVLQQDMNFFDTEARDENILYRISSDAILVQDAIGDKVGHCQKYLSQFFVGFVVGFSSVWQLTLLTLAVVPLIVIAGGTYAMIMSSLSKKGEKAYAEAGRVAEEVISQVRTVYSYGGEVKAVETYSNSLKMALRLGKKSGLAKGLGVGCTFGLLFCAWALLLWFAGVLVIRQITSGGKAFTTILNVIFSGFALGQAAPSLSYFAKGRAAASNIIRMIEKVPGAKKESDEGVVLPKVVGQIEFSDVTFSYNSRKNTIFEGLSFAISAGSTFAVVGESGSGKSTIVSMIERFYEPTTGKILLDGHDINSLQLKWLRNQMGLVSQEPALFSTTITGNILYGREDAELKDIIEAAKVANAHSFIQSLPDGYLTEVGEGGTQLSGGQKQRIAIARAILRDPKILLLDEATSALDAESEHHVQCALEKIMCNRTTIIVAHRLSTISKADTIAVLKNGKIVESGTHMELMSKGDNGEYAMLVKFQIPASSQRTSHDKPTQSTDSSSFSPLVDAQETESHHKKLESISLESRNAENPSHQIAPSTSFIWRIIRLNKPEWPLGILGSIGAILAGAEAPLFALGITHVLTIFYSHDKHHIKHELKMISLIFIGAAVLTVPIYVLQHYFYTLMGEKLTTRVRLLMFSAILQNEIGWFDLDDNSSGSLTSSLAADATLVRTTLADRMSTITQNVSLTVTAFVIAFLLCWQMAAVVIATFPLLIAAKIAEHLFLMGFGGNYTQAYAKASSIAREAITNIRTVAAFSVEDQIALHFADELDKPNRKARLRGHISGIGYGLSQFFAFCSYALGLWYASQLIKHGTSNFSNIMKAFMVLIITAFGVADTLSLTPDIIKGSQALGSVFSILDRKTTINPDDPSSEVVVGRLKGDIEFKNVSFRYPTRPDITVLEDLNLQVAAGSSLALVGRSGSGKSSVIALLMRFYDPNSGAVLVDNKDVRCLHLRSLRRRISLVQQEPALFSTTIYENIAYGKDDATEIEVMKAARAANAHGFISRMPEGYNTQVGDRGAQLSGGQKQRVAIARAILKDPDILLLDEATSALDTASEKVVQEALIGLMVGRTTVIVAHRLSTIHDATMIAVLREGRVQETGTHDELIRQSQGEYAKLVQLQQEKSE